MNKKSIWTLLVCLAAWALIMVCGSVPTPELIAHEPLPIAGNPVHIGIGTESFECDNVPTYNEIPYTFTDGSAITITMMEDKAFLTLDLLTDYEGSLDVYTGEVLNIGTVQNDGQSVGQTLKAGVCQQGLVILPAQ